MKDITVPEFDWSPLHLWETIQQAFHWLVSLGNTLLIGMLLEAALFAVLGYLLVRVGWRLFVVLQWRKRRERSGSAV